ncbi:SidA/IucD/PvdA family monooxygenase [Labrys sp. La1]|uniref:SidA/IucD/PvdA family monooxygenase n=1 Tax=Labrys sp. La1 TaxID=3404917 RepID=UPI003EBC7DE1
MKPPVIDIIGIGFGPANLALAVALDDAGFSGSLHFIEARPAFAWQPTMLLRGSDIQHNPLRDLITPVNPRSRYGFVNYLHQSGRFFDYLNLGSAYPLRREFAHYVGWVSGHFSHLVSYDRTASSLQVVHGSGADRLLQVDCVDGSRYLARAVVVGPGRSANIPEAFAGLLGEKIFHLSDYLPRITQLSQPEKIVVVGASQSAVEIMLDLDGRFPQAEIYGLMRGYGYRLKDTSPFTGEIYFPQFTDYFHAASWDGRMALSRELRSTNYSAADADVINQLYLRRYESHLEGRPNHLNIINNADIRRCISDGSKTRLTIQDRYAQAVRELAADAVVLATGFLDLGSGGQRELIHPLLSDLCGDYEFHPVQGLAVARDYSLVGSDAPPVYLNGLCESSHGFGDAGSFSLLSIRARDIAISAAQRLDRRAPIRPPPKLATAMRA